MLLITLSQNDTRFAPGARITGKASWALPVATSRLDINFFWYTRGKGTVDIRIIQAEKIINPNSEGEREFGFSAPDGPLSFAGNLVSLLWGIELVDVKTGEAALLNIQLAPVGVEIAAGPPIEPEPGVGFLKSIKLK